MDQPKKNNNNRRWNRRKRPATPENTDRPRQKAFLDRGIATQARDRRAQGGQSDDLLLADSALEPPSSAAAASSAAGSPAPPPPGRPEIASDAPRFDELAGLIDPVVLQTIAEDLKFELMTPVQAATIRHLLGGGDVLAQAKTGTGKTVAFLLPAIQKLLSRRPGRRDDGGGNVSLLVISPTRELALQIAKDAEAMLQRLPRFKVCTAIGGTNKDAEERRILSRAGCHVLIATPGRLIDHLTTDGEDSRVRARLSSLDTLVLDEADRLLDMGFLPSLKDIIGYLPSRADVPRQGMLFSATVADHVSKVTSLALAPDHQFISTIPQGEAGTHERVAQHLVVVPTFSDMATGLVGALRHELADAGGPASFKAIVFAPTAAMADFYASVLEATPDLPPVTALHARMTQSKRTRTTDAFRASASGILVATDVVARGLDFPAVSNVFQAGIPSDKESYIHRLGRTARAGAEGRGTFIVTSHEAYFPRRVLRDIPFVEQAADLSSRDDVMAAAESLHETHAKTYQAWLGFYKSHTKPLGWDNERLVREGAAFARDGLGAPETPSLYKSTVGKMGLKGVKGLVVVPDPPRVPRGGGGGGGRSTGAGGKGGRGSN